MRVAKLRLSLRNQSSIEAPWIEISFTIIFKKMDEGARTDVSTSEREASMLSGESLVELDELAELRRLVTEIIDPEPLSFTTS